MWAGGHNQATCDPSNFDWRAFVLMDDAISELTSADLPPNYPGCLGCARLDHNFRGCPNNQDQHYKRRFHMNYTHIKAHIAQRNGSPPNATNAATTTVAQPSAEPPRPTPTETLSRDRHTDNRPAWVVDRENAEKAAHDASSVHHQANSLKRRQNLVFTAHLLLQGSTTPPSIRSIPCLVENKLPNINLDIGRAFNDLCITVIYDSCGAISSGYLWYHLWVASQYPKTVASLEYYNDSLPFEPVMLGGAITATTRTPARHGMLSAVIAYHTPYTFPGRVRVPPHFRIR